MWKSTLKNIFRKKTPDKNMLHTELTRCLGLFDLIMLGIGCMVGAGIFVVTGTLARDVAGPGIVVSYIISGFAALLSALCYAEFGALMPRAGSAYSYTYLVMGELPAFLVGWNMLLEMIIGISAVAKASSGSIDALFNGAIANGTMTYIAEFNSPLLSKYPDLLAVLLVISWSTFVALGVSVSAFLTNAFTLLNIILLVFVMSCGVYFADVSNWSNPYKGGFFPFGFSGVVAGSAACFFSYSGFEAITSAAEESKNPTRHIPIALIIVIFITTLLYVGASGALTLMIPFEKVDTVAPFVVALEYHHLMWGKKAMAVGSVVGLSASLLTSLYVTPRTVYAMSQDGLLFEFLGRVNAKTKTPLNAVISIALVTSLLTAFFSLKIMVDLLSIGTLLCFVSVSVNLLILRYTPEDENLVLVDGNQQQSDDNRNNNNDDDDDDDDDEEGLVSGQSKAAEVGAVKKEFSWMPGLSYIPRGRAAPISVGLMLLFSSLIILITLYGKDALAKGIWWTILPIVIFSIFFFASFLLLFAHQPSHSPTTFQVPLVPLIPVLSMLANLYLILNLSHWTWLRLVGWLLIGFVNYFAYGIKNSRENTTAQYERVQEAPGEQIEMGSTAT